MTLRTNVESIGALKLQESVLDPEGAIQAAANFQMLGGAVGKLGDPFQLLYMAQTNVEGLQDELVKSAKSAAMFNKETGQFDVSTQDMYRLREQAKITGANLEDLVNTGREAAKLDYIKEKFNLDGLPEDQQKLISQLATVGKDGKLTVDIPGFGEIEATDEQQLKLALSNKDAQSALAEYQKNATLSDRKIAEQTLTVQERQQITTNEIKNAVLSMMSDTQLKTFTQKTQETNKLLQEKVTEQSKNIADGLTGTYTSVAEAQNTTVDALTVSLPAAIQQVIDGGGITGPISTSNQTAIKGQDMIFTPNDAPQLLAKGKIYEGIVGDEIAIGTNLTDALNKGGGGIGGKIDININLTGSIGGDPGQLSKMFNSPQVQKQIMDTVLYKLNDYKRQQGVIS
jgi:ATP-dependent protease HslVU (ClpYQ) peptidase subunit